jgi:hypothetical protein
VEYALPKVRPFPLESVIGWLLSRCHQPCTVTFAELTQMLPIKATAGNMIFFMSVSYMFVFFICNGRAIESHLHVFLGKLLPATTPPHTLANKTLSRVWLARSCIFTTGRRRDQIKRRQLLSHFLFPVIVAPNLAVPANQN